METVFISDLHLHPNDRDIANRFDDFLRWLPKTTKNVYILGDFLHVWAGDDTLDLWSFDIAMKIRALKERGMDVYYLHGNRDFLLGKRFHRMAGWKVLHEPALIRCGEESILLVHGDRYCTKDKGFQWFRKLTRNPFFCFLFSHIPLELRLKMVSRVRSESQRKTSMKSPEVMDVVEKDVIAHMKAQNVKTVIHGHTHKQGLTEYPVDGAIYRRYVLSDWDDNPVFLCYDKACGVYFDHID